MSDERERELIEAKREGFTYACKVYSAMKEPVISEQAARRYPMPPVVRPLRVTLSDGRVWSYDPRHSASLPFIEHNVDAESFNWGILRVAESMNTPDDYAKLARILSGETEEVDAR